MADDDAVTLNRARRVRPHSTKTVNRTVSAVVRSPMVNATQAGARPKEICSTDQMVSLSVRLGKGVGCGCSYMGVGFRGFDVRDQQGNPAPGPSYCSSCATVRRGRP